MSSFRTRGAFFVFVSVSRSPINREKWSTLPRIRFSASPRPRVSASLFVLAWTAAILLTLAQPGWAAATPEARTAFPNSIKDIPPGYLLPDELTAAERANTTEFMVALKMRDLAGLKVRIAKGELIPPEEMAAKYYPLQTDYQALVDWLKSSGLTITKTDPCGLGIFVSGSADLIRNTFQAHMAQVRVHGETYTAALTAPSLPAALAAPVLGINGLQPYIQPHKHLRQAALQAQPDIGNAPPYLPSEILTAYNANGLGLSGAGQTIGIVIDGFPATSDLTQFWTRAGVSQTLNNVAFIQVVGGALPAPSGEETLDTEWSSGIASGAKVRVYAVRSLTFTHINQGYQAILNDLPNQPTLHQVSCSFGAPESNVASSELQTQDQYFTSMVAGGVNVFISTGDDGYDPNGTIQVESPASDPNVMGCGGTSLSLNAATGAVRSESGWSGSGGGSSTYFSRPAWQTGAGVPAGTMRLLPDVAAPADPNTGALVVLGGTSQEFGGTSWSAPTWAGFCALLNQARANIGLQPLRLLGPQIYPLIGTGNFRDITTGNNGYAAGPGFDLCTGIGVPNLAALAPTLAPPPFPPVITSATTTSGTVGQTLSYSITATHSPTSYNATGLPSGLTVNTTTGVISGVPAAVGTTGVMLSAANASGTGTGTLTITVILPPPPITSADIASGFVGQAFSYTITATHSPNSFNATDLPPGLTVETTTGVISGTPTMAGTTSVTISASNAGGTDTATLVLTISLLPAPVITSAATASGTAGLAFSYFITATHNPNSYGATGLPSYLTLDAASGAISGTAAAVGTTNVTVSATNASGTGTAGP